MFCVYLGRGKWDSPACLSDECVLKHFTVVLIFSVTKKRNNKIQEKKVL